MKKLKESFRRNGLLYTLIIRNEYVALYGIGGEYTDKPISYEVDIIYIRKDQYGERERIAANSDFGIDRSRCFANEQKALEYYDDLTVDLRRERELYQGVPKVVSGVGQNDKVIHEYQVG
jgi:hypothetical protein